MFHSLLQDGQIRLISTIVVVEIIGFPIHLSNHSLKHHSNNNRHNSQRHRLLPLHRRRHLLVVNNGVVNNQIEQRLNQH